MKGRSRFGFDVFLFSAAALLVILGILFIFSSGFNAKGVNSSHEYLKQIGWAVLGFIFLFVFAFSDYQFLKNYSLLLYFGFLILLVVTLLFGRIVNGARSWFGFWGVGIQTSEFAKLATILYLANYLSEIKEKITKLPYFLVALLFALLPFVLILIQPDMGTALVYVPIFLFMVLVAGAKKTHLIFLVSTGVLLIIFTVLPSWEERIVGHQIALVNIFNSHQPSFLIVIMALTLIVALTAAGYLLLHERAFYWILYGSSILFLSLTGSILGQRVLKEYQIVRLISFLDPLKFPKGSGWHIIQAKNAVGAGGLWGEGFIQGKQNLYGFLPSKSTDFIFSIIAEEWGFWGGMVIFILFLVILVRGIIIMANAKDRFAVYTGTGIVAMIFFHFIINVGMAMGIMPITGIPLLFLSYGGSSLITSLMGIGILLSIYLRRYRY